MTGFYSCNQQPSGLIGSTCHVLVAATSRANCARRHKVRASSEGWTENINVKGPKVSALGATRRHMYRMQQRLGTTRLAHSSPVVVARTSRQTAAQLLVFV